MRRLLLCSGPDKPEGWTTLDANPRHQPDVVATVPPLPSEVRAVAWDEVALVHGIEHFYLWDALVLLHEVREVLAPGGRLVLEQPNIEFAARVLLGLQAPLAGTVEGQCDLWPLYGDPGHRDPLFCHRWGWTPESLARALGEAGFRDIRVLEATTHYKERDFRIEGTR